MTEIAIEAKARNVSGLADKLWRRMSERGDFPALTQSVRGLIDALHDEGSNSAKLADTVMSDVALTQKVLKLANSAMYASFGGEVSTVTHAIAILGHDALGHLAVGVKLLDSLRHVDPQEEGAQRELARAMLAASVAKGMVERMGVRDGEDGVVASLLHRLGSLLVAFYLPELWRSIQVHLHGGRSEEEAAQAVLGLSFAELGTEIARRWRLPAVLAQAMHPAPEPEAGVPSTRANWLRAVAGFSHAAGEVLAQPVEAQAAALQILAEKYSGAFGMDPAALAQAALEVVQEAVVKEPVLEALMAGEVETRPGGKPASAERQLQSDLSDISAIVQNQCRLTDALNMVLEAMYRSLGLRRALAFLRNPAAGTYRAAVGFGMARGASLGQMEFPEAYRPDVFHVALAKATDIFIENARAASIAAHIPAWYRERLPEARAFILLPLVRDGKPLGLLYGDWEAVPGVPPPVITGAERALLRALRDQVLRCEAA
jgi:HD-like signal output (HDOD) protein